MHGNVLMLQYKCNIDAVGKACYILLTSCVDRLTRLTRLTAMRYVDLN